MPGTPFLLKYSGQFFSLIGMLKTFQNIRFEKLIAKIYAERQNDAKLKKFRQNFHPVWAKMMANLFRRGIWEI
jgi:hypothetical protein